MGRLIALLLAAAALASTFDGAARDRRVPIAAAAGGGGTITEVSSAKRTDCGAHSTFNNSVTCVITGGVTSGDLIVVAGSCYTPDTPGALTAADTLTTGYTVVKKQSATPELSTFVAYGKASSSGANTVTMTHNAGASFCYWTAYANVYAGVNATPLDVDGGFSEGTSTAASDSITVVSAAALVVGVYADSSAGQTGAITQTYGTLIGEVEDGAGWVRGSVVFNIETSSGGKTAAWTLVDSSTWIAQTISFKP